VSRALILRTIGICAAILAVVLLTDYIFDTYLLPKPPPYNPWTTLWITVLVSPPIIFTLLWQGERVRTALSDLAQERAIRLAEAEQARDAAQAATRAKSVFLANMSHEIRTPLNGVLGMTQALQAKEIDPEAHEMVETIRESGVTLMTIVNDVLDLSKIESGRMDIFPVDSRLAEVIESCCRLFKPEAREKGIDLNVIVDPSVPDRLSFDATRIRQCLCNLVSNATKFTDHGKVSIRASGAKEAEGKTRISVTVADTGPGIDSKMQDRLFQAFAQADQSTKRRHSGTGLGLTISRDLARLMGGDIVVKSRPGAGAEFTLSFVAAPARHPAPKPRPQQAASAALAAKESTDQRASRIRGARVLLTDDNAINRQVARLFLQPQGAVITEAGNGREALDLLEKQAFDLVLLDCNMPVMDGMEAIVRIRSSGAPWATLPVIALTANAMSGDRERLLALGMSGYVSKPVDRLELYAEIERVLGAAADTPSHVAPVAPGVPANDGPDLGDVLRTIERIAKR
jgi:signal transduction histidine kinase/ActR/RegA family two-component response regulator